MCSLAACRFGRIVTLKTSQTRRSVRHQMQHARMFVGSTIDLRYNASS
jgi:hypothetical protein